jgi:GntR family transcriptional regulator/MocR family aminotransferase
MDSPVQIPFKTFIQLKPDDHTAIYLQIVFEFIKAIQLGLLPEGTKLPGTRILCKILQVNRNTLIKAFLDLESQGFIAILPNKGTFILSDQKKNIRQQRVQREENKNQDYARGFTFRQSAILEDPREISALPLQFNDGLPDSRLMHTDVLARLYVSRLKKKRNSAFSGQVHTQSQSNFKTHFCNYLNLTRGLRIASESLLATSSHETGLYLVTKLLITPGDIIVIASPGYYLSNMTLSASGAKILAVPVNDEGLQTSQLRKICQRNKIRALYLTSNYHYPSTVALSAKRRMEILELARLHDFIIIEDDYDFDFHHDHNPLLPLAAFDSHNKTVYIGSFARSLPAGFGFGFVVAQHAFIHELKKHQLILEPGLDVMKEQVLTDWIQDGEVHRMSKKNKKIYRQRRDHFVCLLNEKLNNRVKFQVPSRGLAIWVEWLDQFNLMKLRENCVAKGLFLPKTILYQNQNLTATRLGFGHLNEKEMEDAVEILSNSLKELIG